MEHVSIILCSSKTLESHCSTHFCCLLLWQTRRVVLCSCHFDFLIPHNWWNFYKILQIFHFFARFILYLHKPVAAVAKYHWRCLSACAETFMKLLIATTFCCYFKFLVPHYWQWFIIISIIYRLNFFIFLKLLNTNSLTVLMNMKERMMLYIHLCSFQCEHGGTR